MALHSNSTYDSVRYECMTDLVMNATCNSETVQVELNNHNNNNNNTCEGSPDPSKPAAEPQQQPQPQQQQQEEEEEHRNRSVVLAQRPTLSGVVNQQSNLQPQQSIVPERRHNSFSLDTRSHLNDHQAPTPASPTFHRHRNRYSLPMNIPPRKPSKSISVGCPFLESSTAADTSPRSILLRNRLQQYLASERPPSPSPHSFDQSSPTVADSDTTTTAPSITAPRGETVPIEPMPTHAPDDARTSEEQLSDASMKESATTESEIERAKDFQVVLDMICSVSLDPVIVTSEYGVIKAVNNEALTLFGYKRWELVGQNVKILMPPGVAEKHDFYMERYRTTRMRRTIGERLDNMKAMRKDGTQFPIVIKVQDITDKNGTAFVGVIKNVELDAELLRIRNMISNMLPAHISDRLQKGEKVIADNVTGTVMFIDLVGFTSFMSLTAPELALSCLASIFSQFDSICQDKGAEKVKTIGDAYMAVCGHHRFNDYDHAIRIMEMALDVLEYVSTSMHFGYSFQVRIGVATGTFIAGVLNCDKFTFDVWGDCVNVASRLQCLTAPSTVMVSAETYRLTSFRYEYDRHEVDVKGKGLMEAYTFRECKKEFCGSRAGSRSTSVSGSEVSTPTTTTSSSSSSSTSGSPGSFPGGGGSSSSRAGSRRPSLSVSWSAGL